MRQSDNLQPRVPAPGAGLVDCPRGSRASVFPAFVVVLALFAFYGAWRAPVPGVNEPHYLTKSRHFWDPSWCARDLFLDSTNVHYVFYATVGSLTRFFSFETSAWIGRLLAWGGIAAVWVALGRRFAACRWRPVLAAALFLGCSLIGNLSGEWLLGGVEAKAFAYAFLFLAVAFASSSQWLPAATFVGLATSFHPVIGGWGVVCLLFATGWSLFDNRRNPVAVERGITPARLNPSRLAAAALSATICSLPGLIPAVAMLLADVPAETKRAADRLQVFERLAHHLDPMKFTRHAWILYAVLLGLWLALQFRRTPSKELRFFNRFVAGTLLVALGGMAVGFGPRWASVLKFYPFRLADLFLPMGISFTLATHWDTFRQRISHRPRLSRVTAVAGYILIAAVVGAILRLPSRDQNPTNWSEQKHADWQVVCQWMKENTPADALCLTPRLNYTFRWHAERAEYAIWKDCPQDAPSLMEWKRRLTQIEDWRKKHKAGFTSEALAELRAETGIDYIVGWYVEPYRVAPVFKTKSFSVYRLPAVARGTDP